MLDLRSWFETEPTLVGPGSLCSSLVAVRFSRVTCFCPVLPLLQAMFRHGDPLHGQGPLGSLSLQPTSLLDRAPIHFSDCACFCLDPPWAEAPSVREVPFEVVALWPLPPACCHLSCRVSGSCSALVLPGPLSLPWGKLFSLRAFRLGLGPEALRQSVVQFWFWARARRGSPRRRRRPGKTPGTRP